VNFDVGSLATALGAGMLLFLGCALPFGVFVPGGSVLVLVLGALAAKNDALELELWFVLASAQTLGQWVGFFWGRRLGPLLEKRIPPTHPDRADQALSAPLWALGGVAGSLVSDSAKRYPFPPWGRRGSGRPLPFLLGAGCLALAAWLWVGGLLVFARLARVWIEALFGV